MSLHKEHETNGQQSVVSKTGLALFPHRILSLNTVFFTRLPRLLMDPEPLLVTIWLPSHKTGM